MIYHLSLSLSNVHFSSYYGACHFSKRKKVMRNQCKVLSYPPLFSGAGGKSTATPSASEFEAVCPSTVLRLCSFLSVPFFLSSLPLPLPPACMSLKSFLKELEVLFLLMFSLTDRTLCGVSVFTSHTAVGEPSSPVWGWGEGEQRAGSSLGAPPIGEYLPFSLRGFPGLQPGRPVCPARGEKGQQSE